MSDKELLALAAKAAGIDGKWWHQWVPTFGYSSAWKEVYCVSAPDGAQRVWNPLEDDGDALRLAVHLGLTVYTRRENEPNHAEATRRAIVEMAAAIAQR